MTLSDIGISPAKEKQFARIKKPITTPEELIKFTPRSFLDLSKETGILQADQISCISVIGKTIKASYGRVSTIRLIGVLPITEQRIDITIFNQSYRYEELSRLVGKTFSLAGKITYNFEYLTYECQSPAAIGLPEEIMKVKPVYSKIPGMSEEYLTGKIKAAWDIGACPKELFTDKTRDRFGILSIRDMYRELHFPKSIEEAKKAQQELQLYEFINFAYKVEKSARTAALYSPYQIQTKALKNKVLAALGFELTDGQKKCVSEMEALIQSGRRLNSVIMANVGAGKTAVCQVLAADLIVAGGQCCVMAPTSALSKQHYRDFFDLFEPLGVHVVYLAADAKARERKRILEEIKDGTAQIIVGTHSLVSDDVIYNDLKLCAVDEEQRFGVACKDKLLSKAAPGCHLMLLSATPIPKTLNACIHGGMQTFEIRSMPKGRLPIITGIAKEKDGVSARERTANFIYKQVVAGHQAYIVCPMIEENDNLEGVLSIEEASEIYHTLLDPYGITIETLTGKDKKEDIDAVMQRFKEGKTKVLLSTTVIEVGINVANASVMIIENAERFGLAQMHQLRGRVGRSSIQSYCVLISEDGEDNPRLKALCESNDGFYLAGKDLELRGGGDVLGFRQHGENRMLGLIMESPELYEKARKVAGYLLDTGEEPEFDKVDEDYPDDMV